MLGCRRLDPVGNEGEDCGSGIWRVCALSLVPGVRARACAVGRAACGVLCSRGVAVVCGHVGYAGGGGGMFVVGRAGVLGGSGTCPWYTLEYPISC